MGRHGPREMDEPAMIALSPLDLILGALAIGLVVLALRPYVPPWAWYAFELGAALYYLIGALQYGPARHRLGLMGLFSIAAALTWWRDLRGTSRDKPRA